MNKKIKTLELFAGYGSQALGLKRLGYEIDPNSEIVEFGVNPAIGYNILHEEYNQKQSIKEWNELLGSVSNDTKKLAKTIKKSKRETLVDAINKTNNFRNVLDYNIKEEFDLLTYSFPCQDLSNQGSQKGMKKDSGTRSGLLWEVERMLLNTEYKPKVLLMENVKNLIGKKNIEDFNEWIKTLEELGYYNTYKVLNSAHFGVGQNRERVFMLSFLDKEAFDNFKWPEPSKEKTPFSKHMMSLEEIEQSPWPLNKKDFELNEYELLQGKNGNYKLGNKIENANKVYSTFRSECEVNVKSKEVNTLTTSGANQHQKVFSTYDTNNKVNDENRSYRTLSTKDAIADKYAGGKVYSTYDTANRVYNETYQQPSLMNRPQKPESPKVFSTFQTATKVTSPKKSSETLTTVHGDYSSKASKKTYQSLSNEEKYKQIRANAIGDYKKEFDLDLYAKNWSQLSVEDSNNPQRTVETSSKNKVFQIIKERGGIVRFVRPLEKARLMGLTDQEFWKLYNSVLSTNEVEAMLGNSIVVDVLEAILKNVTF